MLEIEADGQPESEEQGDNSKELRDSGKARKLARMIKSGTVPEDIHLYPKRHTCVHSRPHKDSVEGFRV